MMEALPEVLSGADPTSAAQELASLAKKVADGAASEADLKRLKALAKKVQLND